MKASKKLVLLLASVLILTALCFSGCSSITVDGHRVRNPDAIVLPRIALHSPDFIVNNRVEIETVMSYFDGAEFILSDEGHIETDENIKFEERALICIEEVVYDIAVAENGRAECKFGNKHYITAVGAVDFQSLNDYVDNKIQEYFDKIKAKQDKNQIK